MESMIPVFELQMPFRTAHSAAYVIGVRHIVLFKHSFLTSVKPDPEICPLRVPSSRFSRSMRQLGSRRGRKLSIACKFNDKVTTDG
jgi:hypothetical protein